MNKFLYNQRKRADDKPDGAAAELFSSPYGKHSTVDTAIGPARVSVLNPIEAHLSMYRDPFIGMRVFDSKRRARIANLHKLYPKIRHSLDNSKPNLPAVPLFADSIDPVNVGVDAKRFIRTGNKPILVVQGAKPLPHVFTPSQAEPSYAFFQPYDDKSPIAGTAIVNDISKHRSSDPQLTESSYYDGGVRSNVEHELAHYLAQSPTVFTRDGKPSFIPVADPRDGVVYTSTRRGYGNSVAEAQGGMYRLAAWFANKYGYVPKTFSDAVTDLQVLGYLDADRRSPHRALKFSHKFSNPNINGYSSTLDDQLANFGYVFNGHIGPYKYNIKPNGYFKTFKDRRYILDRQNDMWSL